jgi:hypothetical protein
MSFLDDLKALLSKYGVTLDGQPAPTTTIQYTNGMTAPRADGYVQLEAFAKAAASDPHWNDARDGWWDIADIHTTFPDLTNVQLASLNAGKNQAYVTSLQAVNPNLAYCRTNTDSWAFRYPDPPRATGVTIANIQDYINDRNADYQSNINNGHLSEQEASEKAYPTFVWHASGYGPK